MKYSIRELITKYVFAEDQYTINSIASLIGNYPFDTKIKG